MAAFSRRSICQLFGPLSTAIHAVVVPSIRDRNLAAATTLAIGVGKELHDRSDGRYFSWKDLVADVTGGTTAAVLVRQVDR